MIFEELIQLHLTSCDKLTDRLAVYNNVPAVFNQKRRRMMTYCGKMEYSIAELYFTLLCSEIKNGKQAGH